VTQALQEEKKNPLCKKAASNTGLSSHTTIPIALYAHSKREKPRVQAQMIREAFRTLGFLLFYNLPEVAWKIKD
jgi:hypothetical protein